MPLSQEETLGLIQGLPAVVKEQNASNKSRVEELGTLQPSSKICQNLLAIVLPPKVLLYGYRT